ncbi:MAG: DUF5617 domain-containing protein [Gammaproteobacteria bacterium]
MTHKKPRNYFYPISIVLAFLFLAAFSVSFFTNPLMLATWAGMSFESLLGTIIWTGQVVAGAAYLGRFFDLSKQSILEKDEEGDYQNPLKLIWKVIKKNGGELIGIVSGIVASIVLVNIFLPVPFFSLFTLITIGRISSLFNRIGRVRDIAFNVKEGKSLWRKKRINYLLAVSLGLIVGIALITSAFIFVNPAALVAVAGLTTFTGISGALVNVIFSFFVLSSFVSACSYIGRWFDIALGKRTFVGFVSDLIYGIENQKDITYRVNKNKYETILTLTNVPVGLIVGIAAVALVSATAGPLAFVGFPAILSSIIITAAVTSTIAGLAWRVGYSIDQMIKISKTDNENEMVKRSTPYMDQTEIRGLLKSYTNNSGILGLLKFHWGHHHANSVKKTLESDSTSIEIYRNLRKIEQTSKKSHSWNEKGKLARIITKIGEANPDLKAEVDHDAEFQKNPQPMAKEEIRARLQNYVRYSGVFGFFNGHANHHHTKSVSTLLSQNLDAQGLFAGLKNIENAESTNKHWNSKGELAQIIQDIETVNRAATHCA